MAPVSSHPAFPAIVALWFAALLGLGSLILPVVLLERLTVVTGIASLVPSAVPPLGFTARAMLALAAAVAGAIMGMLLARKVALNYAPLPRDRDGDSEPARRPISAHDELGEEGLGVPEEGFGKARPRTPAVQKRRALAIAEDNARSEYLNSVPLPDQARDHDEAVHGADDDALDLGDFAGPGDDTAGPEVAMTDGNRLTLPEDIFDEEEVEFADNGERQEFRLVSTDDAAPPEFLDPFAGLEEEPESEEEDETAHALPFSAPSLRRKEPVLELPSEEEDQLDDDMPDFSLPQQRRAFAPAPIAAPIPQAFEAPPKLSVVEPLAAALDSGEGERPLDDLGLVQLAARLGASLERRRAQRAAQGHAAPISRPIFTEATEDFDAAAEEEAARARADFFGGSQGADEDDLAEPELSSTPEVAPIAMPQAFAEPKVEAEPEPEAENLSSYGYDEEEDYDDGLAASFSLPLRKKSAAAPQTFSSLDDDEEESDDDDEGSEEEYSSLLAMKNPFQRQQVEFVRIDEPEPDEDDFETAVTFPARKHAAEPAEGPASEAARPFDPPPGAKPKGAPRDHGDAERELRAALETLQRMSGAA